MDQQQPMQTNQMKIKKLHLISARLQQKPMEPDRLLRDYISTYVQSHHRSDQFFTTLCENRFLVQMLQNSSKLAQSTTVLQCLNLLLTNTKNSSELVYILSQNAIHDYLFGPNILQKDHEFIEYYVQLIKTILMKIAEKQQNKSLIRLFCNNKYPNFPLFTYTTILANDTNQLIKVTAQQCILILVGMINERKIYQTYLSEPAMITFIVRLVTQFLKPDTDHQGICKYLADLLYELKNNRIPLLLICNIICNITIVSCLPKKIYISLSFIELLTKALQTRIVQHKNLRSSKYLSKNQNKQIYFQRKAVKNNKFFQSADEQACDNLVVICSTLYRVLIKYLTNKYINSVYLTAYVNLSPIINEQQQQIALPLKVNYPNSQAQWKNLQDYSLKKYIEQEHPISEIQIGNDFLDEISIKLTQFGFSKQFIKIKQNYLKKGSPVKKPQLGFFGRIFNKGGLQQLNNQYMKQAYDFAGLTLSKGEPVCYNIVKQINCSLCPFFSQYILLNSCLKNGLKYDNIKTGQESDSVQADEINFNDVRSSWSFSIINLDIITQMSSRFNQFINSSSNQSQIVVVPKMYIPPSYLFLVQLKDYLSTSINDHINKQEKNKQLMNSVQMLSNLTKVCLLLNVQLNENSYVNLMNYLLNVHQQIQTCLFENGFSQTIKFIKKKSRAANKQIEGKKLNKSSRNSQNKQQSVNQEGKVNNIKIKQKQKMSLTYTKLCCFESIQKIMDPHIKPIHKYYESKWKQTFSKNSSILSDYYQQLLGAYKISYFGKNGCVLSFSKSVLPATIYLRIQLTNKKLLQIDLLDLQGIKPNQIDNRVLQFCGGNVENIKTETTQLAQQIITKFKQCRFMLQECITNSTVEYLSNATQSLNMKAKKMMRASTQRYSVEFETPS